MSEPVSKHILLVEDEMVIAVAKRQVLESAGYDVTVAGSGENALEIVAGALAPDLVLMDIDLGPGMDGIETTRRLLATHDLPVVFLSSHTEKEYTDRAEQITSYGYIVKDSSNAVLLASIRTAFRLHDAHTALRKSEAELRESQEMALIGRWDFWHRQGYLQWTPMIYRIFEVDETSFEASYEAFLAGIHPDDREAVDKAWRKSLEDRQPYEIEHRLLMDDGRIKWVREYCRSEFDNAGNPEHSIGIVQDITERKQYQEQLSAQTSRLNDVLANMMDLIAITDRKGTFLFAGRSHEQLGYSVSSLVGRNVMDFVHPDDFDYVAREFSAFIESGNYRTAEYRFVCADGSHVWLETSGKFLESEDGTPSRILFNSRDITERKRSEDALKNERRRLSEIIDATNVGTWEWNVQTGEHHLNERWASIIGYTLDELSPVSLDTWKRFTHEDDLKRSEQLLRAHFSGETEFYESEARMRHKDGSWLWVLDRGKVSTWAPNGEPEWVFGTHQDITARKILEQKHLALANAAATLPSLTTETLDYDYIATTARFLSGAKFAELNLFNAEKRSFTTEAIAGESEHIRKASDPAGEVVIIRIATTTDILGDFTLRYSEGNHLQSRDLVETYASMVGITLERIKTEQQNARLIEEKETLLREVQHRIKNNINTMTSLLSLQADTVTDATASSAIRDAESRLRSMQVLYDQLYRSDSHEGGSLLTYLQSLVRQVVNLFPAGEGVEVSVTSRAGRCESGTPLDAKQLSTVGLIVNELVTNAMKYAFPGAGSSGEPTKDPPAITVTIDCPEDEIAISIEDNGGGLPDSFDAENPTGFGLVMVNAMVGQLNGTLKFESGGSKSSASSANSTSATGSPGTRAELRFPSGEQG